MKTVVGYMVYLLILIPFLLTYATVINLVFDYICYFKFEPYNMVVRIVILGVTWHHFSKIIKSIEKLLKL